MRKKTQSVEPPRIAPPSVDMYQGTGVLGFGGEMSSEIEEKLREHTNFNKKQHHQHINFLEKTPFEKELELKAIEMKNAKL